MSNEKKKMAQEYFLKGFHLMSQPTQAFECFSKAVEFDPDWNVAWHMKGVTLRDMGKREEALKCFEKSIYLNPWFPDSWYLRGLHFMAEDRKADAIENFQKAVDLIPAYYRNWNKPPLSPNIWFPWKDLASFYGRHFYCEKEIKLLRKAESFLGTIGFSLPGPLAEGLRRSEIVHDSMMNPGTRLEDPELTLVTEPAVRESLKLLGALQFEQAFETLKEYLKRQSDPKIQLLLATSMIASVPYRDIHVLDDAHKITSEKRRIRLKEAEQLLERTLNSFDKYDVLAGKALNNKAVAMIHLTDYSYAWEDLMKKHQEAHAMFKQLSQTHPSLDSSKVNSLEVDYTLRVLAEEARTQDLIKEWMDSIGVLPEIGVYLTDLRDILLSACGDETRARILEDMKRMNNDLKNSSSLQQQIQKLKRAVKVSRKSDEGRNALALFTKKIELHATISTYKGGKLQPSAGSSQAAPLDLEAKVAFLKEINAKKGFLRPEQKVEYDISRKMDSGKTREEAIKELYQETS